MSILTYTVRSDYPRIFTTSGEKTAITTRTNDIDSWKAVWDLQVLPAATSLVASSDEDIMDSDSCYDNCMTLGLAGWIENSTTYHNKLLSAAKWLAQNTSYIPGWTSRRYRLLALCYAYNFLRTSVITFSEADRKIIGDVIVAYSNKTYSTNEFLDGHSAGNVMAVLVCGITLNAESGSGYDYSSAATTRIGYGLDFWFGASQGAETHLDTWRYWSADGSHWMGAWYSHLGLWKASFALKAVDTGFIQNSETPNSLQLNGVDYAITDEAWLEKIGEYCLNSWWRGDEEYWAVGDISKITNPLFHQNTRHSLSFLQTYGGDFRKPISWLYDQYQARIEAAGQNSGAKRAHDILFHDPSDTDNAATHPRDHTPAVSTTRYFDPPGGFWHRSTWDYDNACIINIECMREFFSGHTHLNCGAIQICVKDDMVLLNTGLYSGSMYGGDHHRYWYQQSIGHSGVPLIDDNAATHYNYNLGGTWTEYPSGIGGQLWKMFGAEKDAYNINDIRFDAGGEAWLRCEVTKFEDSTDFAFLNMDIRKAYLFEYDEIDTDAERVRLCEIRYVIIKGEGVWPIVFRVVRIQSRLANMVKRDHFHSYNNFAFTYPHADGGGNGPTLRASATGYQGNSKVLIDLYNRQDYTSYIVGGGLPDVFGYQAHSFEYNNTNYPPEESASTRERPDLGRYRVEFLANTQRTEEYFVELIHPMGVQDSPLNYTWIDDADWFGVRFSGSAHEYRIHKTLDRATMTGDSTAPGHVTGLTATPGDTQVVLGWTPNTDADIASYKAYKRTKV
jgi:hypothetical protein